MRRMTFGRRLVDGTPVGKGVTVDTDGSTAATLARRTSPVISNPIVGEWVTTLVVGDETGGEYERGLALYAAGNHGPPEHVHPSYEERFEVLEGSFVFVIDGRRRTLDAGDHVTVQPGTPHTFRNDVDDIASCVVETRPAGELRDVIATLSGLAHDGELTENGTPRFLQAMVMAAELADDTVFTSPPRPVQRLLAATVAPVARRLGYRATYPRYLDTAYWTERVEQPK